MQLGAYSSNLFNLKDDLKKTSCHYLKNERKSVPSNVPKPLAYALIHLSAFMSGKAQKSYVSLYIGNAAWCILQQLVQTER